MTFTYLNNNNTPRTSLDIIKQHLQDSLINDNSLITYRLNIARASNNAKSCLEEKIALKDCKNLKEVLEYYYKNRHMYDPHDVFAYIFFAYCPGWEINIANNNNNKLLNEHNIGNLHEIETGIYICFLVEYGIVDSYDELVRFLS